MVQRLGRYEIIRRISSGGMATVYLARLVGEGGFQRLLAVKLMHPHLAEDPEFVNMFLDEGRLAASIRHPNVVATIDIQRSPEGLFLVMDFVDGPSVARVIRHLLRTGSQFDLGVLLRIFLDMLGGLDAAHELIGPDGQPVNLIHRDVSPSNILVGTDGIARITDFGIARAAARITSTRGRQLKGKLPYMAPEQLSSGPIDRRVDVYAAGCVLWEMLALRRLFQGEDEAQLLAAVLQGPVQSPIELRPDVPWSIDRVCMQALATKEQRYPSAAVFGEALEEAARQQGIRIASLREVGRFISSLVATSSSSMPPSQVRSGSETPLSGVERSPHSPISNPSAPSVQSAVAQSVPRPSPPAPAPFGSGTIALDSRPSASVGTAPATPQATAAVHAQYRSPTPVSRPNIPIPPTPPSNSNFAAPTPISNPNFAVPTPISNPNMVAPTPVSNPNMVAPTPISNPNLSVPSAAAQPQPAYPWSPPTNPNASYPMEVGPTTNASVVAFPTSVKMQRSRAVVGLVIALGALVLGALVIWMVSESAETVPGADTVAVDSTSVDNSTPAPTTTTEDETTTTSSSTPTATVAIPTHKPTQHPTFPAATPTPTPTPKPTPKSTPTPTPTPTPSPSEWRPPIP